MTGFPLVCLYVPFHPFKAAVNTINNPFNNYLMSRSSAEHYVGDRAESKAGNSRHRVYLQYEEGRGRETRPLNYLENYPHCHPRILGLTFRFAPSTCPPADNLAIFFCCPHKYRNLFVFNLLRIIRVVKQQDRVACCFCSKEESVSYQWVG